MIIIIWWLFFLNFVHCQYTNREDASNYHGNQASNTQTIQDGGYDQHINQVNYQQYNQQNTNNQATNDDQSNQGRVSHITITKEIPIHQPIPIPVQVEKVIPYPVHVRVPVLVDRPFHVKIYKPYIVPVYKDVPYTVYRDVPIPVKYAVEVPYPVKVPVLVPVPYRIEIDEPVKVPIPDVRINKKGVLLEKQEGINGGEDLRANDLGWHDLKTSASGDLDEANVDIRQDKVKEK